MNAACSARARGALEAVETGQALPRRRGSDDFEKSAMRFQDGLARC